MNPFDEFSKVTVIVETGTTTKTLVFPRVVDFLTEISTSVFYLTNPDVDIKFLALCDKQGSYMQTTVVEREGDDGPADEADG